MVEEKKRILKLVEAGKLSAEEALTLIELLEEDTSQKQQKETALTTEVLFNSDEWKEEKEPSSKQKQSTIASKLVDWIDTAVKKVKELDIDMALGQSYDVTHIFQIRDDQVRDLDIKINYGSVSLQTWNEEDFRVECDAKVYRVENQDEARKVFLDSLVCDAEGSKLRVYSEKKAMKANLTIYVPAKEYDQVLIKLFNGPIRGEHLTIGQLKAKTANGILSFSTLNGEKADLETANGQIKVTDTTAAIEAETINGMISLTGTPKKLDLQSFNGNISVQLDQDSCQNVYAKTTTGSVKLLIPVDCAVSGELKSNLGNVASHIENINILHEKNETIQKELKFQSELMKSNAVSIYAESKTGSVTLSNKR
ncbi:DUF4097 family beta strand repeat-containing protein [Metabacillus arenae]|uniref:DUF4097 domain-containing protein n=1 Tax=Metabacillus arenae TaxID=2771434 RepID=A0A926NI18_9BACI|nr:DUF4097 domain-containing protein [Metabacillus arenae]MBD1381430.1 DUF4097 domain-containing protein [Metabacillus arenae]